MAIDETVRSWEKTTENVARRALSVLEEAGILLSVPDRKLCTLRVHVDHDRIYVAGKGYLEMRAQQILSYRQTREETADGSPIFETAFDGRTLNVQVGDKRCSFFLETPLPTEQAQLLRARGVDVGYVPIVARGIDLSGMPAAVLDDESEE